MDPDLARAQLQQRRRATESALAVLVEYEEAKLKAPPGLFLLPSLESTKEFHGVIFVKEGLYKGGIFKFTLALFELYPADGPHAPTVVFAPLQPFHPLIHPGTGEVSLRGRFPIWRAGKDSILAVLEFLHAIFTREDRLLLQHPVDPEAAHLYAHDRSVFAVRAEQTVRDSVERRYVNISGAPLRFTGPKAQHALVAENVLGPSRMAIRPVPDAGLPVASSDDEHREDGDEATLPAYTPPLDPSTVANDALEDKQM